MKFPYSHFFRNKDFRIIHNMFCHLRDIEHKHTIRIEFISI